MKPSEILLAAKEKISSPDKWTQGAFARDEKGASVNPNKRGAVCWCPLGAITSATKIKGVSYYQAGDYYYKAVGPTVFQWNDDPSRTHEEVMAIFDKAIVLAKADED